MRRDTEENEFSHVKENWTCVAQYNRPWTDGECVVVEYQRWLDKNKIERKKNRSEKKKEGKFP
jgi:hypothetical protein